MLLPSEKGLHTSTTLVDKARTLFAREPVDYQVAEKKGDESMKVQRKDLVEQSADPRAAAKEVVPSVEVTATYENTLLKHLRFAESTKSPANLIHGQLLSEYRKLYPKVNLSDDAEAAASIKAFLRDEKCRGERILLAMRLGQWEQATLQMYSGVHIQPISKANSDFPTRDVFRVGANNGLVDVQHMMDVSIPASVARGATHIAAWAFGWTGVGRKFLQNVPNMHAIERYSRDVTEAQRQPHNWYKVAYDKLLPDNFSQGQESFLKYSLGDKYNSTSDRGDLREITDRILTLADARVELEEKTGRSLCDIQVDLLKPVIPPRAGADTAGMAIVVPGDTHRAYIEPRSLHFKGDKLDPARGNVLLQSIDELSDHGSLDKLKEQVDEKIKKEKEKKEVDTLYVQAKANADERIKIASQDKTLTAAERAALEDPIKKSIAELDKIIAGVQVEKQLKDETDTQEKDIKNIKAAITQYDTDHTVNLLEYITSDVTKTDSIAAFKKKRNETETAEDVKIAAAEKDKFDKQDGFDKEKAVLEREIADVQNKYDRDINLYEAGKNKLWGIITKKEEIRGNPRTSPAVVATLNIEIPALTEEVIKLAQPDFTPVTTKKKELADRINKHTVAMRGCEDVIATAKKNKETELAAIDVEIKRREAAIAQAPAELLINQLREAEKKLSIAKTNRIRNRNSNGWDDDLTKPLTTLAVAGGAPGVPVMSVEDATDEKAKKDKELKLVGKPDRYDEHAKSACEIVLKVITDKEAIEARLANAAGAEPATCDARYADGGTLRMSPIYMKVLQVLAGEDITMLSRKDDLKKWTDALPPEAVFRLLGPPVNTVLPFNNAAFGAPAVAMAVGIGRAEIELVRKKLLTDAQTGMAGSIDLPTRNKIKALESIPIDSVLAASLAVLTNPPNNQNDYLNKMLRRVYAYRDITDLTEQVKLYTTVTGPPINDATFKAYAIEIDRRRKLTLDTI